MHALESRVPPVIVAIVIGFVMWLLAFTVPATGFVFPWREPVSGGLAVAGITASVLGVHSFRLAGTTVNPLRTGGASSLVVSGIYSRTRNPMYLGFLLILIAWAVFLCNAVAIPWPLAFIVFINHLQIAPEERALTARFGQEFLSYKSQTRKWL
jgi:protein-S-isoprenylcysteine O-methyltransferase Ste14